MQLSAKAGGLPIAAPAAGILTSWTVNAKASAKEEPEYLKVLRPTGNTHEFRFVAETPAGLISQAGPNTFQTRIPVQAGDHIGVSNTSGAYYCSGGSLDDVAGGVAGNPVPPMTRTFAESVGLSMALSATIVARRRQRRATATRPRTSAHRTRRSTKSPARC